MKPRALAMALMATGTTLPVFAQTGLEAIKPEDNCALMFVYAVNQVCSLLSNGLTQCQPVGMVGPSPNCPSSGLQPLMPVPLSAPVIKPAPPATAPFGTAGRSYGVPNGAIPYGMPNPYGGAFGVPYAGFAPQPGMIAIPGWPPQFPTQFPSFAPPAGLAAGPAQPASPEQSARTGAAPEHAPAGGTPPPPPETRPVAEAPAQPAQPQVAPPLSAQPATPPAPPSAIAATPAPTLSTAPAPAIALVEKPIASPAAPVATPPATPAAPAAADAAEAARKARELEDALAHFEFDSAVLTPLGRSELDAWLAQAPKDKPMRLTGHADRLGPTRYNLELSRRRAETVRQYLLGKGVEGKHIQIEAKGESEPVKTCKGGANPVTKECLAPNRRVEIETK
ncbi:MAG TPA: OmpA family protein [Thiobacillaceae bacterium]|nr:OmpA family protein [Thiobacillaceae bacterium]